MAEQDPLSQFQNAMQAILQRSPAMRIAMGPKIKNFQDIGAIVYDVNTEADVPRIILEHVGGPASINRSSGYVTFDYTTNVMIDSGNRNMTLALNQIMFALFATIASAITKSDLTALQWRGKSFCRDFKLNAANAGISNAALEKGIKGAVAVCSIVFYLGFSKVDLASFAEGN